MLRWSIATVCMGGSLEAKLAAAAKAGFRAVELFENDLTFFSGKPREVRRIAADLGVEIVALQPFRDFEAMPEPMRRRNFERARRKLELADELGTRLLCLCSNVLPEAIDDPARAANDLAELADIAQTTGRAPRIRGARLGPPCQRLDRRLGHRARRRSAQSRHRARQLSYLRARHSDRAARQYSSREDRARAGGGRARAGHGPPVVEPALSLLSGAGRLSDRRLSRCGDAHGLSRPAVARNLQRSVPRRLRDSDGCGRHTIAARGRRRACGKARAGAARRHRAPAASA